MRTCYTGQVCKDHLGQTVTLFGWVHRRRDHGGVIFIDMRDRAGLAQIVFDPDNVEGFAIAERLRNEFCIRITGLVRERPAGTTNKDPASGEIEILCREVESFRDDEMNLAVPCLVCGKTLEVKLEAEPFSPSREQVEGWTAAGSTIISSAYNLAPYGISVVGCSGASATEFSHVRQPNSPGTKYFIQWGRQHARHTFSFVRLIFIVRSICQIFWSLHAYLLHRSGL